MIRLSGKPKKQLQKSSVLPYNSQSFRMKINVPHIAKLANLKITKDEEEKFEKQLSAVLSYVDKLSEVNTENVEPTSQVTGLKDVLRKDEPKPSLPQADALSQAPVTQNNMFQVKGVFETE